MKIKLTKAQIVRALQTEPLKAGSFVHFEEQDVELFKNKTGCATCAVGSLLDCSIGSKQNAEKVSSIARQLTRWATFTDFSNDPVLDGTKSVYRASTRELVAAARKIARQGNYLSALSSLFEALSERGNMTTESGLAGYRLVNILVNFVKSEFPNRLVLDTNKSY